MILNIITFLTLLATSFWLAQYLSAKYGAKYLPIFRGLIFFHSALAIVYYLYALNYPSDSYAYYLWVQTDFHGKNWMDYYGVSTLFVQFVGYPFIKYMDLPYESLMMLFAWFGLIGFFFFYLFFKETVRINITFGGIDLLTLIFFLPNLHFWSSSYGKGSIIFLGIGLFFWAIRHVKSRVIALILGAIIIYHVRPHILFIILVGVAIGFAFSTKGVSSPMRIAVVIFAIICFSFIYNDVISLIGFEEKDLLEESAQLTRRIRGLTRANSGVDITQYGFPLKLFTFLFRPLFLDASGFLAIVVSFENLFYLWMFSKILRWEFISFLAKSDYLVKTCFISFLGVSSALAQISANLGLAMRQKSQVMILMLFVILKFLDEQRIAKIKSTIARRRKLERIKMQLTTVKE